tara:strand:- start:16381 stop:16593 length:213 start_codon:yes stop_codon:yes gene_type:complete
MGLRDFTKTKIKKEKQTVIEFPKNSLDKIELSIILNLIKETSFKGEDIESVYNLILKLQDQYFTLEKLDK